MSTAKNGAESLSNKHETMGGGEELEILCFRPVVGLTVTKFCVKGISQFRKFVEAAESLQAIEYYGNFLAMSFIEYVVQ